ncbi:hypothetical protein SPSIL_045010 [Sporomusa silvacetica DSM 10669]|uniref:Uncharacterized protein n=1 Tax=Sporomusa silvacetica DSM 10669 TaxID=1123289 RepID=A0ABZ3IRS9_9FIRM|nr:hypothetical protein SPSIL_16300 [Sporomusa silvacetica DSM 10669]
MQNLAAATNQLKVYSSGLQASIYEPAIDKKQEESLFEQIISELEW